MTEDVRTTAGSARGIPASRQNAGGFTKAEFDRWAREDFPAVQRIARLVDIPMVSDEHLYNQVGQEISRARTRWSQQPAVPKIPRTGPDLNRPMELRAYHPRPDTIELMDPDGLLHEISVKDYEMLNDLRREAVAAEQIHELLNAVAGIPQRYQPTPTSLPTITQVDRGLARPTTTPPKPGSAARAPSPATATFAEHPAVMRPGMSRNELMEPRSRDASHPDADLVNLKQPAIDMIGGKRTTTWDQQTMKGGKVRTIKDTIGGQWIQLKTLEAEGTTKTEVEQRIKNNLIEALGKFDQIMERQGGESLKTNVLDDGTAHTEIYRKPGSLHVSLNVVDLAPHRAGELQRFAEDFLRAETKALDHPENQIMGTPVTVSVIKAPE